MRHVSGMRAAWNVFAGAPLEDGVGWQLGAWTSPSVWSQRERGCPKKELERRRAWGKRKHKQEFAEKMVKNF